MEFTEIVNFEIVKKLNMLSYIQFKDLITLPSEIMDSESDLKGQFTKLKNYTKEVIKSNNKHIVSYDYTVKKDFGRLFSNPPSLQKLYNGFRGILCDGLTYDLDMSNCHPTILINLCNKHKLKCEALVDYANNREANLSELMEEFNISRDTAKCQFLRCINKQTITTKIDNKKIKSKRFLKYSEECVNIINSLYELYKNEYKIHIKDEKEWNIKGSLVNLLLCKKENEYLQKCITYLQNKDIKISTLMYDGLMIYIDNDNYKIENVIKDLNKLFLKENIKWTTKTHNIELLIPLMAMKLVEVDTFIGDNIIEVANYILDGILKDKIYNNNDTTFLYTKDIILSSNIPSKLYNIISDNDYYFFEHHNNEKKREEIKASKIHTHIEHISKALMNKAPCDNDFINSVWKYTQFKLFFLNGYYDFKLKKFIEGTFNQTFIKINKNYVNKSNVNARKILFEKILYPVFSINDIEKDGEQYKLLQYFLYRISRVMAGNIEDKIWILLQGLRNCGKGVISDLLKNCFEAYINTTNIGNFFVKKNNTDIAKSLSWMIDFEFSRLAITQEMSSDEQDKIDGNMIKKFCSGGDTISARKNHKDEYFFKLQSALMVCCNDCPDIKPTDAMEFCNEFQMKSKFVDKVDKMDANSKLNTFNYYEKDPTIKSELLNDPLIIMEFINVIFEAYNDEKEYPLTIKKSMEENEDDDDYSKLFDLFNYTNDENNFLSNNELNNLLKANKIPFNLKKCKMLLKTKGVIEGRKNTDRGLCKLKQKDLIPDDNNNKKNALDF